MPTFHGPAWQPSPKAGTGCSEPCLCLSLAVLVPEPTLPELWESASELPPWDKVSKPVQFSNFGGEHADRHNRNEHSSSPPSSLTVAVPPKGTSPASESLREAALSWAVSYLAQSTILFTPIMSYILLNFVLPLCDLYFTTRNTTAISKE